MTNNNIIDELTDRLVAAFKQVAPTDVLERLAANISPALETALKPFQIIRQEDFDGYMRSLERLEGKVAELEDKIVTLEQGASDNK